MTERTTLPWNRRRLPHAQIHLPPLSPEEALLLCNLLERAITALWRTHGDAMSGFLACLDPEAAVSQEPCTPVAPPTEDPCDIF